MWKRDTIGKQVVRQHRLPNTTQDSKIPYSSTRHVKFRLTISTVTHRGLTRNANLPIFINAETISKKNEVIRALGHVVITLLILLLILKLFSN